MGERNFEVYGLGQCCLDYIGRVDAYPPADTKCEVREMVVQGGGPVATALVALARWGVRCTIASVIGDDEFGSAIKASLEDEGVDTSGLIMRKGFDSQFSYIAAEPGAGTRTVFWRRPTGAPPRFDELDHARIHGAKLLHTDGLFMEASLAAATAAKEAGVQVVVDAGSLRDGMLDLARLSDYFLASEKLAGELVGDDRPVDACFKLAELGPRVVGVTLGHRGYVVLHGERIIERPAYPVDPVDTTGCGDVFHAGFTYGVIKGWDVERSLDFGAWAAAMVSLQLGGRTGIPPKSEYPRINPRSS
jgi:ribokinase